jgi:hypothetical protein
MASFLIVVASIVALFVQIQQGRGYSGASMCAGPALSAVIVSSVASQMQIDFEGNYQVAWIICTLGFIASIIMALIPAAFLKRFEIRNLKPRVGGLRLAFIYTMFAALSAFLFFQITTIENTCHGRRCRGITNIFDGDHVYTGLFLNLFLFNVFTLMLMMSMVAAAIRHLDERNKEPH